MAQVFKNAKAKLADSATVVYTVPAATTAIVIGCQVANMSAVTNELDFYWTDASDTDAIMHLGKTIVVPAGAAYEPIGGKLVLEAGDKLVGIAENSLEMEVTVSVLELS